MAFPVEQQWNAIECGVFALAFIHYILSEKKTPVEVNFDTSKMRTHLFQCLVENKLSNFQEVIGIIENVFTKPFPLLCFVFCNCRMPLAKSDYR